MQLEQNLEITDLDVVKFIKQIVAIYFDEDESIYERVTRKPDVIRIKHYALYFCQKHTALNYITLKDIFRLQNHSSVSLTIKKIDGLLSWDRTTKKEIGEIETIIRLKGLAKGFRVDLEKYYFVNMDTLKSVRDNHERAILFVGYSDDEITNLTKCNADEIREHKNTKRYILEPLKIQNNDPKKETKRNA
jgi:hypothetical protein